MERRRIKLKTLNSVWNKRLDKRIDESMINIVKLALEEVYDLACADSMLDYNKGVSDCIKKLNAYEGASKLIKRPISIKLSKLYK